MHVYEHHLNRVEESVVRQWDKDPREAAERATLRVEKPDILREMQGDMSEQSRMAAEARAQGSGGS